MLRLYQADKLEILARLLAQQHRPPSSPFQPDVMVVQSLGMGRWISLRLADQLGICANVDFILPAAFVWELRRRLFGELPRRSPFATEVLTFRIMAWLDQPANLDRAPRLAGYLQGGGELRRFHLAARIADVFDQYLMYREDWISAWENHQLLGLDGDEAWQALLWRDLVAGETAAHRARWMRQLLERIQAVGTGEKLPGGSRYALPERLSVFGVSALPPMFTELLKALGNYCDVALYTLNPCREYWGEIRDPREIGKLAGERRPEDLYLEVGHPLLASLGKQGREFFDALADTAQPDDHFDENPERDTLLHLLQADILELIDRKNTEKVEIAAADRSVQIHACHSAMREVEVLRDHLLSWFDADPSLQPGDVAVLTPDIEKYTPYIEAVFAEGRTATRIPFSIADRGLAHRHPLLENFLSLLDLPESRFSADATLAYLEQPAILRRFGLSADDLPQIHAWARAVGARWGRDAAHKAAYELPETPRHTWRDAVQRLMLGYALPREVAGAAPPLFEGAMPFDDIEGGRALILGGLAEFLETLFDWAGRLTGERSPAEWAETLTLFIDRMFDPRGDDEAVLAQLRKHIDTLRDTAEQARFRDPLAARTVKSWLAGRLGKSAGTLGFLTGAVTFCAMVPMRSLPFRVIALLGLNYDTFPRNFHPPGFDLTSRHPRRGDRSRRLDDRYLFLETLLSARERLYLSYVGRGIRDNGELPPSPLVSELIDVAKQSAVLILADGTTADLAKHLVTVHPLQPFDPAYFKGNGRLPGFSTTWLDAARKIGRGEKNPVPLFEAELPEPEEEWRTLDPDSFVYFYSNPARYLLRRRLNLILEAADGGFDIREPFALGYDARDTIRRDVLHALRQGRAGTSALAVAEAQGLLPHGPVGLVLHGRERSLVETFAPELLDDLDAPRLAPLPVEFAAEGLVLSGFLAGVSAPGILEYGFDSPKPHQLVRLWLRHLLLCLAAPEGVAKRSLLRTPQTTIELGEVDDAATELAKLLRTYAAGLRRPLPLFPKASYTYAKLRLAPSKKLAALDPEALRQQALEQARGVWAGSDFVGGEGGNAYYQAVYRDTDPLDDEFERLALAVLGPLVVAMEQAG
ncbi:exodeoxyribonuclease V subunit gamma [Methylomagnum ishizawai]|uniref:exodeoxyribonuclease V subunit gamma n=1 Tax=Methylomagnum ishizawai TaxID=1760988 RepID=UPI001C3296BB|nr:exodeoxyribonuclease V subunit gamma [Methylomagnum ishizawai]BBL75965.1 RecBCD enzyme subunit RecC [Methylomagnum ishizawai]